MIPKVLPALTCHMDYHSGPFLSRTSQLFLFGPVPALPAMDSPPQLSSQNTGTSQNHAVRHLLLYILFFSTELQALWRAIMMSVSALSTRPGMTHIVGESESDITLLSKEVYPQWRYFIPGSPGHGYTVEWSGISKYKCLSLFPDTSWRLVLYIHIFRKFPRWF